MRAHTATPWRAQRHFRTIFAVGANGLTNAVAAALTTTDGMGCACDFEEARANANHIVACVNGCEGINPEAVGDMLEALRSVAGMLAIFSRPGEGLPPLAQKVGDEVQTVLAKARGTV